MVASHGSSFTSASAFSTIPDSAPDGDRRKEVSYPNHDPRGLAMWEHHIAAVLDAEGVLEAAQTAILPLADWIASLDPAARAARTPAEHLVDYNTTYLIDARAASRKVYNILIRSPGVLTQRMITRLSNSTCLRSLRLAVAGMGAVLGSGEHAMHVETG